MARKRKDQFDQIESVTATVDAEGNVVDVEYGALQEEDVDNSEIPKKQPEPDKIKDAAKVEKEPFHTYERKLFIYENVVIQVPGGTKKTVVQNVGGGELYVSPVAVSFNRKDVLADGQLVSFDGGVDKVFISSASRPTFRISFYN